MIRKYFTRVIILGKYFFSERKYKEKLTQIMENIKTYFRKLSDEISLIHCIGNHSKENCCTTEDPCGLGGGKHEMYFLSN